MLSDSIDLDSAADKRRISIKLIAVVCAFLVTGAILAGYAYIRKRHAERTMAGLVLDKPVDNPPQGDPRAEVLVNEPVLKGSDRIISGTVRNISGEPLDGVSVELEFRRRDNGKTEETSVPLEPARLETNQEGTYSITLSAQTYGSVRFVGLTGNPNSSRILSNASPGRQRPPERIEPKMLILKRPVQRGDEFLNSPDKPARVP